ncbi:MAG: AI-2E family transporter [Proteobacteria bacterium]|nr:AI-2E family transporter [Pseudomonadota bacterium]
MTDHSETPGQAAEGPAADDMPLPTNPQTIFLGGLFTLAVLAALYVTAEVVLPVILAIILKLLLQPFVRLLERCYIPRLVGAILSVLLVLGIVAGTVSLLAGPATTWAARLPDAIPQLRDQLSFLRRPIEMTQALSRQVEGIGGGEVQVAPPGAALRPEGLVTKIFSSTATATSGLFTTLLVLFYLLMSGETFLRRLVEILPRFHDKRAAVELSAHVERDVSVYLLTVSCINVLVGAATAGVMWLCGMPTPLLWGAIAFALNFMPILGPMVGVVIFLMAGILSLGVTWWAVLPAALYLGIHIAEGEVATPMLLSRRFTINPVAMILALIFCYWMWGVVGAVLAMPLLAITKIVCDDLRPLRAVGHLLEG